MSDNTQINQGSSGDVISTDDLLTQNGAAVSGLKVQRVKAQFGQDGNAIDVSDSSPFPVKTLTNEELLRMIIIELRMHTLCLVQIGNLDDNLERLRNDLEKDL